MTDYTELVKALREIDMCGVCPCDRIEMCEENDLDCITIQAADSIEELQKRLKITEQERDDMARVH